jgi:hypothetical protein
MVFSVLFRMVTLTVTYLPHRHRDRLVVVEYVPVVVGGALQGIVGIGEHYHVCSRCARPMACSCD